MKTSGKQTASKCPTRGGGGGGMLDCSEEVMWWAFFCFIYTNKAFSNW